MRLHVSPHASGVLIEAHDRGASLLDIISPDEARAKASALIKAAVKAEQNARYVECMDPLPEAATVGEVEAS